jgi:hypothetical protein
MGILDEKEGGDTELLTYAMTLVNKVRGIKHIYYETSKQM